jgi:hypothetical protein
MTTETTRPTEHTGIVKVYRGGRWAGYRATCSVADATRPRGWRVVPKRFDKDTTINAMKTWRENTPRLAKLTPIVPAANATEQARFNQTEQHRPLSTLPREDWQRLTPSADGWCYVYFVRAGNKVKIGRTTDPGRHVRALQTAHHEDLALVLTIPAHAALEGAIHRRFQHLKTRGEWFRVEADLVAFIEAVQSGANPIALLW